ncbi:hypothetical protein [Sinosporangium siamense]|uniref:hypothetical protein n=1 Tax=Sinosporangium siamense TaxID=1367973 RepID=UPI00195017A7|nr:hypothetical protein [Sinosporangium siamense]
MSQSVRLLLATALTAGGLLSATSAAHAAARPAVVPDPIAVVSCVSGSITALALAEVTSCTAP